MSPKYRPFCHNIDISRRTQVVMLELFHMSIQTFLATLSDSIEALGLIWFLVLVVADIVLWRIHPALGTIGALIIIAYLLNIF